jgi:hypothetical protein
MRLPLSRPRHARSRCAVLAFAALATVAVVARRADAEVPQPQVSVADEVPGAPSKGDLTLESVHVGLTAFVQNGHGYQSQAGAVPHGPGSERLTVFEPQAIVVFRQGPRFTHRIWVPLDIVTAASPNAIDRSRPVDMVSQASRQTESGSLAWDATYQIDRQTETTFRSSLHLEEDFRSWTVGMVGARLLADDDATVTLSGSHTYDWFDRLDITGLRHGRASRATTNGSAGLTQVLTPTTVVHFNYGLTLQTGELGNTWNAVPLDDGNVGPEILPSQRLRHAIVGRIAQWLPWDGALKAFYRFYTDDWGIVAHTIEGQLLQRVSPWLYVRGSYRFHTQSGADFFTTAAVAGGGRRTADSDLDRLDSHAVGFGMQASFPTETVGTLEMGASIERYVRSNDLDVDIAMWTTGFRF